MKYIAKEGLSLIIIPLILFIIFYFIYLSIKTTDLKYIILGCAIFSLFFFIFNIYFFRDPERNVILEDNEIVSPADGQVILIKKMFDDRFLHQEVIKISIFMSLFNVHVNRVPVSGKVTEIKYNKGKFFSANLNKASLENEYNAVIIETNYKPSNQKAAFVQIAGLVARRIVCKIKERDDIKAGDRFGLIKYGSRLDLYLPLNSKIDINEKDNVLAGKTVIGRII